MLVNEIVLSYNIVSYTVTAATAKLYLLLHWPWASHCSYEWYHNHTKTEITENHGIVILYPHNMAQCHIKVPPDRALNRAIPYGLPYGYSLKGPASAATVTPLVNPRRNFSCTICSVDPAGILRGEDLVVHPHTKNLKTGDFLRYCASHHLMYNLRFSAGFDANES